MAKVGAPKGTVPWNKGKSRNVTWGEAISKATKGRPKSEEHKRKIGLAQIGKVIPEEVRKKISDATTGRKSLTKGLRKCTHPEAVRGGMSGDKHWNWKGGISPENARIRQSSEYKAWRTAVFERDKWTCQICNERGGQLEADHIQRFSEFPELRFVLANGRTLCKPCHKGVTYGPVEAAVRPILECSDAPIDT
jgi:5-methylcytosine-specific restriction endonuclease McrA